MSSETYTSISEKDDRRGYEYYLFGQVDSNPGWWLITLKYHQTSIGQYLGIALDGGRCFVAAPERSLDLLDEGISAYGFYIRDSLSFRVLQFYHKKETSEEYSYISHMQAVLIFQSQSEYANFTNYVKNNLERYKHLYDQQGDQQMPYFPEIKGYIILYDKWLEPPV
jgi:hypothetical protein